MQWDRPTGKWTDIKSIIKPHHANSAVNIQDYVYSSVEHNGNRQYQFGLWEYISDNSYFDSTDNVHQNMLEMSLGLW